jgi:maltose alpha-D-glucosyltransferase/alpha-amylase
MFSGSVTDLAIRKIPAEQSNSSILYGEQFILKVFRKVAFGRNPDCEVGRYLAEDVGFDGVPAYAGVIEYRRDGSATAIVGVLQAFVRSQGDCWRWTLDELGRYYEQYVTAEDPHDEWVQGYPSLFQVLQKGVPSDVRNRLGIYYDTAAGLGRRTAQMHRALASPTEDPRFAAEPFNLEDRQSLGHELRIHAESVFNTLRDNLARLPDDAIERASLLLSLRRSVWKRLESVAVLEPNCNKIRIHGDYHLGQVLRLENDYRILDFEGEPARPLAGRLAKQSPLKDVAGMLRSFSYAAYVAMFTFSDRRPDLSDRLDHWARSWELAASASFLDAYRKEAAGASFLPPDEDSLRRLLEIFLLDKALYELRYEIDNRPAWVRIPLRGILSLGWDANLTR